jgi:MT0933-like antitoxin protein
MADLGDTAKNALNSDQGEKASDAALDKAGDAADSATGGGHDAQVDKAKNAADGKIGQ